MAYQKTKSGILVPKEKLPSARCGFCPTRIYEHNEAQGRIHTIDGKPACARCRILKSKIATRIKRDKPKYEKDAEANAKAEIEKENERIRNLAADSIAETGTGRTLMIK